MDKEAIKVGDKVMCLYRKGNHQEGRIHLGFGTVAHMSASKIGPYFYSIKLEREEKTIALIDSQPYGAVVLYNKELADKMIFFHNKHLRLVLAIEDDYFETLGGK
ncbi:hypothetical protein KAU33_15555 [Candidatus Dependentiae bacterium]|nr:hypothetical protein [Candidatus Dependentiae bacterium]